MEENKNTKAPQEAPQASQPTMGELDFSLFTGGDSGYQVLSDEKIKSLNKQLPAWSLEPPAKHVK